MPKRDLSVLRKKKKKRILIPREPLAFAVLSSFLQFTTESQVAQTLGSDTVISKSYFHNLKISRFFRINWLSREK